MAVGDLHAAYIAQAGGGGLGDAYMGNPNQYVDPNFGKTPAGPIKGRGGWLSSIISELGGAGGATAGAAYGAAAGSIVPGAGTLLGAIIGAGAGGLIGGTGGRLIENKVRDNRNPWDLGNNSLKQSLEEGALSGVFGAGGTAASGLWAASKAGVPLAEALQTSPAELQAAAQAVKAGGALKGGERATADAYNLLPGTKVGSQTLSTADSKELLGHVGNITSSLNPEQNLANIESHISQTGQQIGSAVEQGNRALTKQEISALTQDAKGAISQVAGLGEDRPAVQQFVKDLGQVKDLQGLQAFRQSVADQINFGKVGGVKPGIQQALQNIRGVVAPFVDENVAGLADLNKSYSLSKEALPFLQASTRQEGLAIPIKGPLGKLAIGGKTGSVAKNLVGRGISGVTGGVTGALGSPLGQQLALQTGKGLISATVGQSQPQDQTTPGTQGLAGQYQDPSLGGQDSQGSSDMIGGGDNSMQSQTQSQNSQLAQVLQQAMLQDLQETGGKRIPALKSVYDTVLASQKLAGTPKLSAAQQARKDALSSALGSLDSAVQNLTASGGAQGPKGNLSTIPGIGGYLDPAGASYHNTKVELATALAKAITGGSRPPANVIDKYMHSLPDVNDPAPYAEAKVRKLQNDLYAQARRFQFNDLLPDYQAPSQGLSSAF